MDFNPEQMLTMAEAIIELTDPLESSGLVKNRSIRNTKFEDSALVFYENEWRNF